MKKGYTYVDKISNTLKLEKLYFLKPSDFVKYQQIVPTLMQIQNLGTFQRFFPQGVADSFFEVS